MLDEDGGCNACKPVWVADQFLGCSGVGWGGEAYFCDSGE